MFSMLGYVAITLTAIGFAVLWLRAHAKIIQLQNSRESLIKTIGDYQQTIIDMKKVSAAPVKNLGPLVVPEQPTPEEDNRLDRVIDIMTESDEGEIRTMETDDFRALQMRAEVRELAAKLKRMQGGE